MHICVIDGEWIKEEVGVKRCRESNRKFKLVLWNTAIFRTGETDCGAA